MFFSNNNVKITLCSLSVDSQRAPHILHNKNACSPLECVDSESVDYPKSEYCCWKDTLLLSVSCVFYYFVSTASEILTLLEWWQVSKDLKTEIKQIIQFDTKISEKTCVDRPFNETCRLLWSYELTALCVTVNLKSQWIKCWSLGVGIRSWLFHHSQCDTNYSVNVWPAQTERPQTLS